MEEFESLPQFQALIVAAAGKPERNMGDSVIPAEPPQWKEVRSMAIELAKTAPDQLALHIYRIQAEANVNGFKGFHDALNTTLELLQSGWDSMYPAPDLDDPDDMYYERVNLMNELSEQPLFLDALHRLPLVSVRGIGEFSCRDIDVAAGTINGTDEDKARCQEGLIRGAFAESDKEQLQELSTVFDTLLLQCETLESIFAEKTGQSDVLSLQRLKGRLTECAKAFDDYAADHLPDIEQLESPATSDSDSAPLESTEQSAAVPSVSSLSNRAMVAASFDAILLYYQRHEPSSPVRLLTCRAREFVDKSFFDVAQTLAPALRDNLPAMLAELQKQPLAALISDSYARFLNGEQLPEIPDPFAESASTVALEEQPDDEIGNLGNSHQLTVIESREQVVMVLQDIETYFLINEPASPIPLIITDLRKLVNKRFVELLGEFSRVLPVGPEESGE